jgi:asparagine synthase (glutamine-hydrolysing)|tara:strand:- start:21 stop:890 length:870 start_codon:yes stop_codon:yes gene_type:complete
VYDEPFSDSSQIPMILLSNMTRKHVTVALSGDGADELFGGYNRHFYSKKWWPLINKIPFNLRNSFVKINQKFNFKHFNNNTKDINRLKKAIGALGSKDDLDLYTSYLSEGQSPEHLHNLQSQEKYINVEEYYKNFNIAEKLMILDTNYYLPDNVLVKVDRAAMSQSLETRAPYLNSELFNFAVRIPLDQKIYGNKGKLVQKKLLESYIPNHLIDRPKQGFEPPLGEWLRGPLKEWSGDIINSHNALNREYYKKDIILKRWNEHQNKNTDWTKFLWNIISLESWRIENNI